MEDRQLANLLAIQRWIEENDAEAKRWLPRLLELDGPGLRRELNRHPRLRPGIIRLLTAVAVEACERSPERAHELTSVLIEQTGRPVPAFLSLHVSIVRGEAWCAHASALRCLGRYGKAREAIDTAIDILEEEEFISSWNIARAEVIKAQILHDQGHRARALALIRRAAETILMYGDREHYAQARMIETSMRWDAGEHAAAGEVWSAAAEEALQRGDTILMAYFDSRIGMFRMLGGGFEAAAGHFAAAHEAFDAAGLPREAARALWRLAEATAARGRFHEAISEYYKVQALMLADDNAGEAALVSVEIVELLLITGRDDEIPPLVENLLERCTAAGLPWNAIEAWTFVGQRARAGLLTRDEIARVRSHFETLSLRPNAPFHPPEPAP